MNKQLRQLRKARMAKGITQKKIATIVGISESYYCQLENGTRRMSLPLARKIAMVLDMGLDELFLPSNLAFRKSNRDETA